MALPFSPALLKKAERWGFLLIGLTVAVTLGLTVFASGKSLGQQFAAMPWHAIGWLAVATLVESIMRFWRYILAADALALRVPRWRLMYYYTVGYGLIPTPGKVGTAIRLWLLKQYHGIPYSRSAPLLVMDLVSDSLALAALASFTLLVLNDSRLQTIGLILLIGLAVGLIATLLAPRLMQATLKLLYAMSGKRKPRLFARLLILARTTAQVLGPRLLLATTAFSFAGWAIVGVAIGHLITQMGAPFSAAQGSLAISLATMGGFITMMPAGVGGAEVTMAGLFTLFAVPFGMAVLATAIVRLVVLWATVLIGLALLPLALRNAPNR